MTARTPAPRVSVIVPARNEEKHIAACLDSILAQTWTDLEVVVVDGESEDRTAAVVAGYSARDPRVPSVATHAFRIGQILLSCSKH